MDYREKFITISNILSKNHKLSFRLYNVLYTITFKDNKFYISNTSIASKKEYPTLKDLFNDYIVYGSNLFELIKDIKL